MTRVATWMRRWPFRPPSCQRTSPWCRPTANWPKASSPIKASPEFYQRRRRTRCRSKDCPRRSRKCRWWCWSTRDRPRPARSWPAPCRTTSAPRCWATRPSARARCKRRVPGFRLPLDNCPNTGLKLTTTRYYTPSGKSIQAKGIVPDVMIDETEEGNLFAALRTREADLEKHLTNGQGEENERRGARESTRGSPQAARRRRSRSRYPSGACRSLARTRTSS